MRSVRTGSLRHQRLRSLIVARVTVTRAESSPSSTSRPCCKSTNRTGSSSPTGTPSHPTRSATSPGRLRGPTRCDPTMGDRRHPDRHTPTRPERPSVISHPPSRRRLEHGAGEVVLPDRDPPQKRRRRRRRSAQLRSGRRARTPRPDRPARDASPCVARTRSPGSCRPRHGVQRGRTAPPRHRAAPPHLTPRVRSRTEPVAAGDGRSSARAATRIDRMIDRAVSRRRESASLNQVRYLRFRGTL